ncbi:cupredoxin domain-containing protein [Parvibaculum sp.]|uniref:cupredoxin domain-containing protein n=1 Tax=Parvibaculum sp. TaxID=2024848 RepID=UPI0025EDB3F7|nr:cupredoxin domain-containing protein [Parvibaculum sp.]
MMRKSLAAAGVAAFLAFGVAGALAADDETPTFEITIKDNKFDPATLEVPAHKDIKLIVKNLDETAEEFESHDFSAEKIIAGGGQGVFFLEPMEPGSYKFFGEFHEDTAQGVLVVK